ncbi:MAG: hypothetical protein H6736_06330 [Alphaproteobacteria bacterium]|nr:hypothetical protein [Alphaproteobacteria bacterium]MCB9691418.1 hypothetical protein [Alphaproteobacteria bacterium]
MLIVLTLQGVASARDWTPAEEAALTSATRHCPVLLTGKVHEVVERKALKIRDLAILRGSFPTPTAGMFLPYDGFPMSPGETVAVCGRIAKVVDDDMAVISPIYVADEPTTISLWLLVREESGGIYFFPNQFLPVLVGGVTTEGWVEAPQVPVTTVPDVSAFPPEMNDWAEYVGGIVADGGALISPTYDPSVHPGWDALVAHYRK